MAPDAFAAAWPGAVAAAGSAPAEVGPVRVTVATVLPELTGPDPKHDGLGLEWFTDTAHLERFERWRSTPDGGRAAAAVEGIVDPAASPVLVADELVLRGADWLDERWRAGGARFKHLAIAVRAAGLGPEAFAERWRRHAGTSGGVVIPEAARGLAYVQDHPVPDPDRAYDALNEVWFDDVDGLQARVAWFAENPPDLRADELFGRSWFLAAREDVVA